ncbi:hypothetical protein P7C70_g7018, partial [Phenoliferia sp. Uapishka_3]
MESGPSTSRFEESDDDSPPATPLEGYYLQSHLMTPQSSQSTPYYHTPEPDYGCKDQLYSPHLQHLEQHAQDLRSHLERSGTAFHTPPPQHPQHMCEMSPEYLVPQVYPSYYSAPPPHPGFPILPSITSLVSNRHFNAVAPPPLYHLSTGSAAHSYSSPYPSPLNSSVSSPVEDFIASPYAVASPVHHNERPTCAADYASMPIQQLSNSVGLGFNTQIFNRRYSDIAEEVDFQSMAPLSPLDTSFTYRPRRKSSISFPSPSSLPATRTLSHRSSFSSFVTRHIEQMQDDSSMY